MARSVRRASGPPAPYTPCTGRRPPSSDSLEQPPHPRTACPHRVRDLRHGACHLRGGRAGGGGRSRRPTQPSACRTAARARNRPVGLPLPPSSQTGITSGRGPPEGRPPPPADCDPPRQNQVLPALRHPTQSRELLDPGKRRCWRHLLRAPSPIAPRLRAAPRACAQVQVHLHHQERQSPPGLYLDAS